MQPAIHDVELDRESSRKRRRFRSGMKGGADIEHINISLVVFQRSLEYVVSCNSEFICTMICNLFK